MEITTSLTTPHLCDTAVWLFCFFAFAFLGGGGGGGGGGHTKWRHVSCAWFMYWLGHWARYIVFVLKHHAGNGKIFFTHCAMQIISCIRLNIFDITNNHSMEISVHPSNICWVILHNICAILYGYDYSIIIVPVITYGHQSLRLYQALAGKYLFRRESYAN